MSPSTPAARLLGVIALGLALALGGAAAAYIPAPDRIAKATVAANKASARTGALQIELSLRVADREPIGVGELVTHPRGLARLELRDAAGRVERHLLLVTEHTASRDGRRVDKPRAFLPPLSFMQVDSEDQLQEAFSQYGLDVRAAGLAPCGDGICYVLGDPSRSPPPLPPSEEELATMARIQAAGRPPGWDPPAPLEPVEAGADDALQGEDGSPAVRPPSGPAVWVDAMSFEIVRLEEPGGATVTFGPAVDFEGVRFPDSITVDEPGFEPVRFDVLKVTPVNAAAAAFNYDWLLGDEGAAEAPGAPARR